MPTPLGRSVLIVNIDMCASECGDVHRQAFAAALSAFSGRSKRDAHPACHGVDVHSMDPGDTATQYQADAAYLLRTRSRCQCLFA
ncbi:MAG: hypothetical protein RL033_6831 [Pseudomonadota bacterium]|jgi:hypothetical protein